ncbi:hypothetical protein Dimus_017602 [Dionaea muscipula]
MREQNRQRCQATPKPSPAATRMVVTYQAVDGLDDKREHDATWAMLVTKQGVECHDVEMGSRSVTHVALARGRSELRGSMHVHAHVVKVFGSHVYVQMDMYVACELVVGAKKVFDEMPEKKKIVTWNATRLVKWGEIEAAPVLFGEMPVRNVGSWIEMSDGFTRSKKTMRPLFQSMFAVRVAYLGIGALGVVARPWTCRANDIIDVLLIGARPAVGAVFVAEDWCLIDVVTSLVLDIHGS